MSSDVGEPPIVGDGIYTSVEIETDDERGLRLDADETLILSVRALDLQGRAVLCTPTWAVADPKQAAISQGGVFTPRVTGPVEVQATCGDITGTATVDIGLPFDASEGQELRLWLAADRELDVKPDGSVLRWRDLSEEGLEFSPTSESGEAVRSESEALGDMPVVVADGTVRMGAGLSRQVNGDMTVMFVMRVDGTDDKSRHFLGDCRRNGDHQWTFQGSDQMTFSSVHEKGGVPQTETSDTANMTLGKPDWAVRSLTLGSTRYELYESETLIDSQQRSENASLEYAFQFLFGWCNGSDMFQGALAELLLFQGELTEAQRQRLEAHLNTKYEL